MLDGVSSKRFYCWDHLPDDIINIEEDRVVSEAGCGDGFNFRFKVAQKFDEVR